MRYARNARRLARLLVIAAGVALAGCGSSGGAASVFDDGFSFRNVLRIDRSGPPSGKGQTRFASLAFGKRLRMPEMRVIHVPGVLSDGSSLQAPVAGAMVTSYFGPRRHPTLGRKRMHKGIDLAAPAGTAIRAVADGIIVAAASRGGYGNYIRIRHDGRYSSAYAHMRRFADGMRSGTPVRRGDVIGYVGSTGRSTGPHLHFELRDRGRPVDPLDFMPLETVVALASD